MCAPVAGQVEFRAEVKAVRAGGVLELTDGRRVSLQGVTLPSAPVRPAGFAGRLSAHVERWLAMAKHRVYVTPDAGSQPGVDLVGTVRMKRDGGASLNEAVLSRGLAVFACRTKGVRGMDRLAAAARVAHRDGAGWFGRGAARRFDTLPYLNGAVLGLHHQVAWADYHRQLDELRAAGFAHVCLLFSVFVQKVDSVSIRRDHKRTVPDARLIETIAYAKKKGMSVLLLPILLILDAGDDDWRGVLRPKDEGQFWQNYDRFLAHYLDIAEHAGVESFSIGSELGSLEDRKATWQRIIRNARGRFRGLLTYSVNWDHVHVPRFLPALDYVGMTAYFSLTKKTDPAVDELVDEWRRVSRELQATHAWHKRPVVFTELGYASQDGINRDPWNYVMAKEDIDLQEQEDCFAAFMRVAPSMKFLGGAYFYDYYDLGGARDWSYSPRGKPAMELWRRWAKGGKPR